MSIPYCTSYHLPLQCCRILTDRTKFFPTKLFSSWNRTFLLSIMHYSCYWDYALFVQGFSLAFAVMLSLYIFCCIYLILGLSFNLSNKECLARLPKLHVQVCRAPLILGLYRYIFVTLPLPPLPPPRQQRTPRRTPQASCAGPLESHWFLCPPSVKNKACLFYHILNTELQCKTPYRNYKLSVQVCV